MERKYSRSEQVYFDILKNYRRKVHEDHNYLNEKEEEIVISEFVLFCSPVSKESNTVEYIFSKCFYLKKMQKMWSFVILMATSCDLYR